MRLFVIAMLASAGTSHGFVSGFHGGRVRSPDGRWTISSRAVDADSEGMTTIATLVDRAGKRRPLVRFERGLEVVWLVATRQALLVERTIHFSNLHLFDLQRAREVGAIERDIERHLRRRGPSIVEIENRLVAFGREGSARCILVEESGLPRGRSEGSFIARRAYFRLDLVNGRAVPARRCAGAAID